MLSDINYAQMIADILQSIREMFVLTWWIVVPTALFFIWQELWVSGLFRLWKLGIKWTTLEVRIPRNIEKTPKAMENVFNNLHAMRYKVMGFEDTYFNGSDYWWFSAELIGEESGVHFYFRFPKVFRNLVEAAIYSEYPDAELFEVEDYVDRFPDVLPNEQYEVYATDYVFDKENAYPLQTYEFFEEIAAERRLDPVAVMTESMSRLKEGQHVWVQILFKAVNEKWENWIEEGEELRDKLMERKKDAKAGFWTTMIEGWIRFWSNFLTAAFEKPEWPGEEKKEEKLKFVNLSPGEQNTLKALEKKISKHGFETNIRFLYIDRRERYGPGVIANINGAMKQFKDLNSFTRLDETETFITSRKLTYKSWFRKHRLYYRRRWMFDMYKLRWFSPKPPILTSEELATMFHFPLVSVEAPLLRRLETRKGEPPAGLPI